MRPVSFAALVGAALEEAVRIGDLAVGEGEPVQHRQAVEPVPHRWLPTSNFAGPGRISEPVSHAGNLAVHGEGVDARLGLEGLEAGGGGSGAGSGGGHGRPPGKAIVRSERFGLYVTLRAMSRDLRLTDTSYVVLGLVELCQPATPYDLKQFAKVSVFNFWSVPHTQVYSECARLAEAGLLDEEREEGGRRRRVYRLTADGKQRARRVARGAARRRFRAARPGPAEAVLRRRPEADRASATRDASAAAAGVRGAPSRRRGAR